MARKRPDPRSRANVLRFYRGARRHPKWNMGRPPGRRSGVRRLIWVVLIGGIALLAAIKAADAFNGTLKADSDCAVLRLVDGDTIDAWCSGGIDRVRLDGFDTAEIFSPGCFSERVTGYRGLFALRLALLQADRITLEGTRRDRYDRRLMRLRVDGEPVEAALIRQGLAVRYSGGQRIDWCQRVRIGGVSG